MRQRNTDPKNECKLIEESNRLLAAILETFGASVEPPQDPVPSAYEYAAIPPERDAVNLALPPGDVQFDFDEGAVKHSAAEGSAFPDAGDLGIELRKLDDMLKGVDNARLKTLRSVQVWSDVDGSIGLDRAKGGYIHLFGGLYQSVKSHGFKRFNIHAEYPFEFRANVSTRVDAFETSDQRGAMTRRGERAAAAHDSYTELYWWPGGLDAVLADALDTSLDHTDYQVAAVPTLGHDNATVQIENDGSNPIDARLQARDEPLEEWYQIGAEVTSIAAGDHTTFDVQEEHRELRAQFRNSTNGQTVSASGQLTAGGT